MRTSARTTGRARRASSVRQRLAAVVLLPTLGLAAFGGYETLGRTRESERTREVEVRVERASALLRVKLLVTAENYSTGATASAVALGVDPAVLSTIVGFDPEQRVLQDRRAVDRAVAELGDDPVVRAPYRRLVLARRALDDAGPDVGDLLRGYSQVQAQLTDAAITALDRAEEAAGWVASSSRLRTDAQLLRASVEVATAVGVQLDGLGQLIAPTQGDGRQAALDELRLGGSMDELAAGVLERLSTGRLRDRWRAIRTDTDSIEVRAQFAWFRAMAPTEVPTLELKSMITIFVGGMHALDLHDDLAARVARRTVLDAEALHDEAEQARQVALAALVALVAAGLVLAGLISRSIAVPLLALERRAQRVTEGDLDDDPLLPAGPWELRAVSTTVDELVDNLRVVEWQVGALAAGNLDDPVLEVPVPGRLGRFLHDSVLRLSRSMSEREVLSRRLEHDATHDALTGLLNRGSLVAAARQAIDAGLPTALVKVDLDGFKPVNETHGHETGDRLLRVTAERLRADAPGWDVARIGGDEFAVLLTGAIEAEHVVQLAQDWIAHVGAPVRVGAVVTQVRASAGVAVAEPGRDAEDLLRHAGLAAASAKGSGGGGVGRFDGEMLAEVERRADLETRLRAALDRDELCLHVQPVVDGDLRSHGVEALLRWPQPDGTMVPPCAFIPVAEASDLVIDVGRWVLREACRILAGWTDDPFLGHLRLAVNLSGRHVLSLTVVDDVRRALDAAGVDPRRLSVEVTETVVLSDLALATEHLSRLRALGVAIVIDDFGTGYTSLAHLRQLPVDVIKVDRSLVVDAAERAADARVVELVVGAAKANGMSVVAEGIETIGQLDAMRAAGCDHFQGFLIARPGPVEALAAPAAS